MDEFTYDTLSAFVDAHHDMIRKWAFKAIGIPCRSMGIIPLVEAAQYAEPEVIGEALARLVDTYPYEIAHGLIQNLLYGLEVEIVKMPAAWLNRLILAGGPQLRAYR